MPCVWLPLTKSRQTVRDSREQLKTYLRWQLSRPKNANWIPFVRAYLIGYGTEVIPLLVKLAIIRFIALTRNRSHLKGKHGASRLGIDILRLVVKGFRPNGLAIACGIAMGGARLGEGTMRPFIERVVKKSRPVRRQLKTWIKQPRTDLITREGGDGSPELEFTDGEFKAINRLTTFCAASMSSLIAIAVLQITTRSRSNEETQSPLHPTTTPYPTITPDDDSFNVVSQKPAFAHPKRSRQSSTLDFTLFFAVRALDTIIRAVYDSSAPPCLSFLGGCTETILFQLCCWRIMWCWFYTPERLPITYVKWITALAAMDQRLLQVIRLGKAGEYVYGVRPRTEEIRNLGRSIAGHMGLPPELGDPELITKLSCEIVHGKVGASDKCSMNVFRRWRKAWGQAMGIYLPVFTVPALLFNRDKLFRSPLQMIIRILLSSSRSACFLSSFIGLTWAGVCMGRSNKMHKLLEIIKGTPVPAIYMDSSFAPQLGSFLAGFSILIEHKKRSGEMALYVAMRALCATIDEILPTWLGKRIKTDRWVSIWVERFTFSLSIGVITSAVVHRPDYVRGIVKGIMKFAIGPDWPRKGPAQEKKVPVERSSDKEELSL